MKNQPISQNREDMTIVLPKELFRRELDLDSATFTATELEAEYYQHSVKKERGSERYRFKEILDMGGTGAIFSVLDLDLPRPLAMKVLLPKRKNIVKTIGSFVKEAKINGFLEHPNIIPIHEFGLLKETGIFFTMKLVQGETLQDILREMRRENPEYLKKYTTYLLLSIFRKVCDAIAYAHAMGIIHQDIKPDNIIVGHYGEVFLIDWGAAKIVGDPNEENDPVKRTFLTDMLSDFESLTDQKGRFQGTPSFMSPEQARGEKQLLDTRSDIFLLGATLYTIFTFTPPYVGKTLNEILNKAKTTDLIPPEIRSPDRQIPGEISRIIMKAMASNKIDRYQTVDELSQDIDMLIAGKWLQQEIRVFNAGDSLMREGDVGKEAYLIISGSVLVTKGVSGTEVVLGTYQEGDIIGEMSLISEEPRSATVQALDETTVAVLTKEMLSQNLKKLPPYMEKILLALTDRLQQTDTMIHPYLTSDCTAIALKQLRLIFKDRFGDQTQNFTVPFQEIVEEISQDLGIPSKKVRNVLETAIHLDLMIINKDDTIQIPDMNKLTLYTNRVKMQNGEGY
jgi:serine/threonine-protein kinase